MRTTETNTRTQQVLDVMRVLTWIAYIGVMIKAGAIIISYGVSCINPAAAQNLYKGWNLSELRKFSFLQYTLAVLLVVGSLVMQSLVLDQVIKVLSKVNLANPFTNSVVRILKRISIFLIIASGFAVLNKAQTDWLLQNTGITIETLSAGQFVFMAGIVFVITQVFKRGVELQSENDLTV